MSITRYELTVCLVTDSPLHSGGIDEVPDRMRAKEERRTTARRFARDGRGRPVLTGRSVKGAVRAACERYLKADPPQEVLQHLGAGGEDRDRLWGNPRSGESRAATLTFHSIELTPASDSASGAEGPDEPGLPTRTGIAIDRYWGAAGDTALFEHEYVPTDTSLTLTVTAQAGPMPLSRSEESLPAPSSPPATEQQVEQLFAVIIGLLESGRVAFGGRRNAGWGRVRLAEGARPWTLVKFSLGSREDLLGSLAGGQDITSTVTPVSCTEPERVQIRIDWDSPTGILVAETPAETEASGEAQADPSPTDPPVANSESVSDEARRESKPTTPLRSGLRGDDLLVLPGSSIRGALRSRASRIARTVLAARRDEGVNDWSETGVHDQLAADPSLVRDLFGTTERRGTLSVLDTLASSSGTPRTVTHNAGDRWTGGVAEGALYSEEVHDVAWNAITLELDPNRLPADDSRRRAAWCLLGLVLAELATGTLPLGSRGTRGLGQVEVKGITVTGLEWLGLPDGGTKSFTAGAGRSGRDVAEALLGHLKAVNTMITPNAGSDAAGWSSYLIDVEEKRNG